MRRFLSNERGRIKTLKAAVWRGKGGLNIQIAKRTKRCGWMAARARERENANSISSWKPYFNKTLQTSACPSQFQQTFFSLSTVSFACHSPLSENGVQNDARINKCHSTLSPLSPPSLLSVTSLLRSPGLHLPPCNYLSILSTLLIFSPFYLFSSLSLLPCFWTVNLPPWLPLRPYLNMHTHAESRKRHTEIDTHALTSVFELAHFQQP